MKILEIRATVRCVAMCGAVLVLATGCNKKQDNTMNYKSAIDSYYSAHPACLWPDSVKFPVQADTSDASKTSSYDALVDQGLLVRTTAEKKVMIVASKQVNNYDLSDKGRSAWTADTAQPGYGNFCFGHRKVTSLDSSTPTTSDVGATTQVTYHTTISDAPDWAKAAETQTAFPKLQGDFSSPQSGEATLTNTSNGWQMASAPRGSRASAADGKVVE